jgi:hypothetical protein
VFLVLVRSESDVLLLHFQISRLLIPDTVFLHPHDTIVIGHDVLGLDTKITQVDIVELVEDLLRGILEQF